MAERLHPGIYVEERRAGTAPITGVSTSNMGIVGYTQRGPENEPVLVTNFSDFERKFGSFTSKGQVPTHTFAFFANGGKRAYVVRTLPADALSAKGTFLNKLVGFSLATGDGTATTLNGTLSPAPVAAGSVQLRYRVAGTAVTGAVQSPDAAPDGTKQSFAFVLENGGTKSGPVVHGSVTITYTNGGAPQTVTDTNADGILYEGAVAVGRIDYETGAVAVTFQSAPDNATNITADYTPLSGYEDVVDDGSGNLVAGPGGAPSFSAGTVNYTTGAVSLTTSVAIPVGEVVRAAFHHEQISLEAQSRGEWGNGVRVAVRGNASYYNAATATYSRHDVLVYLSEDGGSTYTLAETFEDLSFSDPTDKRYVLSILNSDLGSELVKFVSAASNTNPAQLDGFAWSASGGPGNGANLTFGSTDGTGGRPNVPVAFRVAPLQGPIAPGTVRITFKDAAGTTYTIQDDGFGALTGTVVDPAATASGGNFIDYTTGHFSFTSTVAPVAAELVDVSYSFAPSETETQDDLTGGSDGTALTRNELTDPALLADRLGMYALLKTGELMNVVVPDAAGNVTMSTDIVTECERNGLWFAILAPPPGQSPQRVKDYRLNQLGVNSSYAALYYPYIRITDPVTDLPADLPPGGHIAGVFARVDGAKSVGKAPAGVDDGRLLFSIGLERKLEFAEIDILHPNQVNALVDTPQTGRAVWGARTLERPPSDFRYVHVRRLTNFLKKSIYESTHVFVFENVGSTLRNRIKFAAEGFLFNLFQRGVFAGNRPEQAYAVVCDESNNPPEVEARGEVICDIYIAPNTPGEFITFRIQQKTRAAA